MSDDDTGNIWKTIDGIKEHLAKVETNTALTSQKLDGLDDKLIEMKSMLSQEIERGRANDAKNGAQDLAIAQAKTDIDGVGKKIENHLDVHRGLWKVMVGIPSAVAAFWMVLDRFVAWVRAPR